MSADGSGPRAAGGSGGGSAQGVGYCHYRPSLGTFLRSRRERLAPAAVGLHAAGRRRAAGLRREEVAQLAGISPTWYMRLEQDRAVRPSREVLDALARALRLDAAERAYLFQVALSLRGGSGLRGSAAPDAVTAPSLTASEDPRPGIGRLLETLGPTPALVIDAFWDVIACNAAFAAVLPGFAARVASHTLPTDNGPSLNLVEYLLTLPALRATMPDWASVARLAVDGLRASLAGVGTGALASRAAGLVARLGAVSPEFRTWWPEHGLWTADRAVVHVYDDPRVGRLEVDGTMLDIRSAPGLTLLVYVPRDPATRQRLRRLADVSAPGVSARDG